MTRHWEPTRAQQLSAKARKVRGPPCDNESCRNVYTDSGEGQHSADNNSAQRAKRLRGSQTPAQSPVPGSLRDLVSQTSTPPVPHSWESVNPNTPSIASPDSGSKPKSYAQLAAEILKDKPNGLSTREIYLIIKGRFPERAVNEIKAKGAIGAALSANARGDKPMFEKRPSDKPGTFRWILKDIGAGSSSHPTDGSLDEGLITHENDSPVVVAISREPSPESLPRSTADNAIDERAREGSEKHHDDTATSDNEQQSRPPDASSSSAAEILNEVIAGQPTHGTTRSYPAEAPPFETTEHPVSQDSQHNSSSMINLSSIPLACKPHLAVYGGPEAVGQPIASFERVKQHEPLSEVQNTAVAEAPIEMVAKAIHDSPAFRELAPAQPLQQHLAAMLGVHLKLLSDCFQQQAEEFRKQFSLDRIHSTLMSNGDVDMDPKALLDAFQRDAGLETALSQPASTVVDAHQALNALDRARAVEMQTDLAISHLAVAQTKMGAMLDSLEKKLADDYNTTIDSLRECKARASASKMSSRQSLSAYIG